MYNHCVTQNVLYGNITQKSFNYVPDTLFKIIMYFDNIMKTYVHNLQWLNSTPLQLGFNKLKFVWKQQHANTQLLYHYC